MMSATLALVTCLVAQPSSGDTARIDFFENTLPVYSYLSRNVRDSDILSPLSRLLRPSKRRSISSIGRASIRPAMVFSTSRTF